MSCIYKIIFATSTTIWNHSGLNNSTWASGYKKQLF